MDLEQLLHGLDAAAANLAKLESVWERAKTLLPTSAAFGDEVEYGNLQRAWCDLIQGGYSLLRMRLSKTCVSLPSFARTLKSFATLTSSLRPFAPHLELKYSSSF